MILYVAVSFSKHARGVPCSTWRVLPKASNSSWILQSASWINCRRLSFRSESSSRILVSKMKMGCMGVPDLRA